MSAPTPLTKRRLRRVRRRRPVTWAAMATLVIIDLVLFGIGIWEKTDQLTIAVYEGIEGESLKHVAQRFSDARNTRVEILEFPYDELFEQERLSLLDTGTSELRRFDVIMLDDPWLEGLLGDDPKSPRLSRLTPPDKVDADDFFPSCLRVGQHPYCEGEPKAPCSSAFYAMPFVGNSQLLCYRGPDHPPSTWAEVAAQSEKDRRRPRNGGGSQPASEPAYAMRLGPGNSIVTDFIPMLWEADPGRSGGPRFASAARSPLGAETEAAFRRFKELSGGRNFGTKSLDDFDLAVYMADGKTATSIIWSGYAMALAKSGVKELQFGALPGRPVLGAWLLAAPANRPKVQRELAKKFIAFATSREQLKLAAKAGNPPPRKSVLELPSLRDNQYRESFPAQYDSLEKAWPRPRWTDWWTVERRMGACLSDLSAGLIDADEARRAINRVIGTAPGQQTVTVGEADCASRE